MIAESWYPIHYFKLSFGKYDSLYAQSLFLRQNLNITIDANKEDIKRILLDNIPNNQVKNALKIFSRNVPYRFLSPWIKYSTDKDVATRSQRLENNCIYSINGEYIDINNIWIDYLTDNYNILRDYALWNLTEFLQKRNPNVPNVPSKLIKPIQRDSLVKQHKFWNNYISIVGSISCIYTGKQLLAKQYDLDHFVPWSFVSHNLIWNLIPADASINSSKSNNIPPLDIYLKPFATIQHNALKIIYEKAPNDTIFEDYLTIYDSIPDLIDLSDSDFYNVFKKTFTPIVQIAENMGFDTWQR